MKSRYRYGDAWERYPIEPGEIWGIGKSIVAVWNLFDGLPDFMRSADLLFIDPPWNLGNLNCFYTKAGRSDYRDSYKEFTDVLFSHIKTISPRCCYIEIGNQGVEDYIKRISAMFSYIQNWPVTYYRKNPCWLVRGSNESYSEIDYTGIDEAECIKIIASAEEYGVIGDLCMGRGLLGKAAFAAGRAFVGTELNKRRLACLLDSVAKAGGRPGII